METEQLESVVEKMLVNETNALRKMTRVTELEKARELRRECPGHKAILKIREIKIPAGSKTSILRYQRRCSKV